MFVADNPLKRVKVFRTMNHAKRVTVHKTFDDLQVAIFKGEQEETERLMKVLKTLTGR